MASKAIKLHDGTSYLLPVTNAELVQIQSQGEVKSVQQAILENELVVAEGMNDLNDRLEIIEGKPGLDATGTITSVNATGALKTSTGSAVHSGSVELQHKGSDSLTEDTNKALTAGSGKYISTIKRDGYGHVVGITDTAIPTSLIFAGASNSTTTTAVTSNGAYILHKDGSSVNSKIGIIGDGTLVKVTYSPVNSNIKIEHIGPGSDVSKNGTNSHTSTALSWGANVTTKISYVCDSVGHIKKITYFTQPLPANPNVTSRILVAKTANGTTSTATNSSDTTYINHLEGSSVNSTAGFKPDGTYIGMSYNPVNSYIYTYHLAPTANTNAKLSVDASGGTAISAGTATQIVTGVDISRDAYGHVTALSVDSRSITIPNVPEAKKYKMFVGKKTSTATEEVTAGANEAYIALIEDSSVVTRIGLRGDGSNIKVSYTPVNSYIYVGHQPVSVTPTTTNTYLSSYGQMVITQDTFDANGHYTGRVNKTYWLPLDLKIKDTRSITDAPFAYTTSMVAYFKASNTNGLNDGFFTLLEITPWNDASGGYPHEVAFTANGRIWHRQATSTSAWGAWKKVLTYTTNLKDPARTLTVASKNVSNLQYSQYSETMDAINLSALGITSTATTVNLSVPSQTITDAEHEITIN